MQYVCQYIPLFIYSLYLQCSFMFNFSSCLGALRQRSTPGAVGRETCCMPRTQGLHSCVSSDVCWNKHQLLHVELYIYNMIVYAYKHDIFAFLLFSSLLNWAATKTPMYSFYHGLKVRWPRGSENGQHASASQAPRKLSWKGSENQSSRKRWGTWKGFVFLATFLISTICSCCGSEL